MRVRPNRTLATAALAPMLLLACGDGDDDSTAAESTPTTTAEPTDEAIATPESTEFDVGEEFTYAGFVVAIESGALVVSVDEATGEPRYAVALDASITNLGQDEAAIQTETALVQDGTSYSAGTTRLTDIGGGLTGEDVLEFEVDEGFDPDQATLVMGTADEAQASVPLGMNGDEAVPREPQEVDVEASVSLELIDLEVTGAELRYDDVARHEQVEDGSRALVLDLSATSRNRGNWSINDSDLALTRPDGVSVPVDNSRLGSLTGADGGVTTEDLYVQFVVDEDAAGEYTLVFAPGDWWIEDGLDEATATFTLP